MGEQRFNLLSHLPNAMRRMSDISCAKEDCSYRPKAAFAEFPQRLGRTQNSSGKRKQIELRSAFRANEKASRVSLALEPHE
jgi:hypothetical protein